MNRFSKLIEVDGRRIGNGQRAYIIAEAGVAHFGKEEKAYQLVDLAVQAGADAVKFQIFDVDALISNDSQSWKARLGSRQLPFDAFERIQKYCREKGITFFATAHDECSFEFINDLKVPLFKIGSGELSNWDFIRKIASKAKPVIISTGMYTQDDILQLIQALSTVGNPDIALLHCITSYPTPPEEANLSAIRSIRELFDGIVGYSDHTRGYHFPLAAVALGAQIIEKHITLDFDVPDAQDWKVSCGPNDLHIMIQQIREIQDGLGEGTKFLGKSESPSLEWARKSLVAACDLNPGDILQPAHLTAKRPGTGIPPCEAEHIIGRQVTRFIPKDSVIKREFVE
jgi:N,N'-diacetyllegionaminate synthase